MLNFLLVFLGLAVGAPMVLLGLSYLARAFTRKRGK